MCLEVQNGVVQPGQIFTIGYGSFSNISNLTASEFNYVYMARKPEDKEVVITCSRNVLPDHQWYTNLYHVIHSPIYIYIHIRTAPFVDYNLRDGSLTLTSANQQGQLCVPIPITPDNTQEGEECFTIFFFDMDNTPLFDVIEPNQARVCITDSTVGVTRKSV